MRQRRGVVVVLAAVFAAGATARLGWWQLDRAAQKTALWQQAQERAALPPLPQADLARQPLDANHQQQRLVSLRGQWLPAHTVWLDNRQMNGRPGFYVVTPLLLAPGDAVLVQRGWQPRDFMDRARRAPVPTPDGEVEVHGRIAPPPGRLLGLGEGEAGAIRQNLDLGEYSREIGVALRPLSVQQTDGAAASPQATVATTTAHSADGLLRQWPQPAADVAKHHGYAFQWFALSALIAGLYVWFQLLRPRRHAPQQP